MFKISIIYKIKKNIWGGGNSLFGIGDSNYSIGLDCFNGYIDEVRTSNIARYETDFTPPTEQQSPDGYTLSYDNFDTPIVDYLGCFFYSKLWTKTKSIRRK